MPEESAVERRRRWLMESGEGGYEPRRPGEQAPSLDEIRSGRLSAPAPTLAPRGASREEVTGGIGAGERALRRQDVDEARHSSRLEGQQSSPEARALQERYVDGELTVDELVEQGLEMVHQRLSAR